MKELVFKGFRCIRSFFMENVEILLFIAVVLYKTLLFNEVVGIQSSYPVVFLSCLGTVLVLAGAFLWFGRRARVVTLLAFDIIASTIMFADIIFYRYFNDVISAPVLMQIAVVGALGHSISSLFKPVDFVFICDLVVFIPMTVYLLIKGKIIGSIRKRFRLAGAFVFVLSGSFLVWSGFAKVDKMLENRAFSYFFDHTYFVQNIGVLNFHGIDTYLFAANRLFGVSNVTPKQKEELKAAFNKKTEQQGTKKLQGAAKGCNLIVVQVEALQNMAINMKVDGREVTPNLNQFLKRSMYFNNYYSQTLQGSTSDAEFLSNVSYYPLAEGSVYFLYAQNTFESMPKAMKAQGYKTMAMHPYRASYWNRSSFYPVMGFDKFVNANDFKIDDMVGWGLSDKSFLKQSLDKMMNTPAPFYSFLITLSSHYPYDAYPKTNEFDAGPYNNTFYGNYLKSIHYTDEALGEFLKDMEDRGLMDKSVVAIYGDHAAIQKKRLVEMTGYPGFTGNNDLDWIKMTNIPLILHLPGDKEAGLKTITGGQVDLFPTLANLFGLQPKYCLGKDLLNTDKGYAILRDGSVIDGRDIYLKKAGECFNLDSGEKVDSEELKGYIDMAPQQLQTSDEVIENNLIPYFEANKK